MKINAISDLHGILPEIPPCDLLLLGGDLCPLKDHSCRFQAEWLDTAFRFWLASVPARKIIGVAGNHDFVFEKDPDWVPRDLPWTYLQDSGSEWEGLRIWGSPWQPVFFDWAFNLEEHDLAAKWAKIPDGTDILVLHGPPYCYGDGVAEGGGIRRVGSPSLFQRIYEVRPRLVVFGHIHQGRGQWNLGSTVLANVSLVNREYEPVHAVWEYELDRSARE